MNCGRSLRSPATISCRAFGEICSRSSIVTKRRRENSSAPHHSHGTHPSDSFFSIAPWPAPDHYRTRAPSVEARRPPERDTASGEDPETHQRESSRPSQIERQLWSSRHRRKPDQGRCCCGNDHPIDPAAAYSGSHRLASFGPCFGVRRVDTIAISLACSGSLPAHALPAADGCERDHSGTERHYERAAYD